MANLSEKRTTREAYAVAKHISRMRAARQPIIRTKEFPHRRPHIGEDSPPLRHVRSRDTIDAGKVKVRLLQASHSTR